MINVITRVLQLLYKKSLIFVEIKLLFYFFVCGIIIL